MHENGEEFGWKTKRREVNVDGRIIIKYIDQSVQYLTKYSVSVYTIHSLSLWLHSPLDLDSI
jgi:hypothetical protein